MIIFFKGHEFERVEIRINQKVCRKEREGRNVVFIISKFKIIKLKKKSHLEGGSYQLLLSSQLWQLLLTYLCI